MLIEMIPDGGAATHTPDRIVHQEQAWFALPSDCAAGRAMPELVASRWSGFADEAGEEVSTMKTDRHVLEIALRPMDVTVFNAQKLVHDGRMQQGLMRSAEPGVPMRAIFRGGYDALHLHFSNAMINDLMGTERKHSAGSATSWGSHQPIVDPVIEGLAHALIRADDFNGVFGRCYAEGVGLAILARFLGRTPEANSSPGGSRVSGLPKWRLKRAVDYIAAHLSEPITLAEMAASTGLTRMHFAAQFRASTGLRPHEYLVRRRIERTQELLDNSRLTLVEIAFEAGFSTQAHFTTVFTKVTGQTPGVWRRQNYKGAKLASGTGRRDIAQPDSSAIMVPPAALVPKPDQPCRIPL
jgi:AraC family transcriptional regulator